LTAARRLALLVGALLLFRLGSALIVFQPGYTDAYYYADVAKRLAAGQGLTADFIWNFMEATGPLPVPSHRFWMPLATVLQGIGIKGLPFLDPFHAAQSIEILLACVIPVVAYLAARAIGASATAALVAAAVAGLGGAFAPGWVSLDAFAPAAVIGTTFFLFYRRAAAGEFRCCGCCARRRPGAPVRPELRSRSSSASGGSCVTSASERCRMSLAAACSWSGTRTSSPCGSRPAPSSLSR